jgi:hypothetical protein
MGSTEGIPADVVSFLREDIESVRQLEALLLLRADPARAWTPEQVSAELRSGVPWSRQQLEDLRAKGMLEAASAIGGEPAFRYAPASPQLGRVTAAVAELFVRRKTTVIKLIFGRLEDDSLRSFADAFRIRKDT